jgi:diaminohydroxyphosphoribosylaminopyrimidine deaminase/5-amino-6-(5-phosphoribosylamino)uracil reductase
VIEDDERWMRRALELAEASVGLASPNPQVGCVLVRDGEVLGEGAHVYDALDHAEIVALKQAADRGWTAQDATAYVTLEPCSHHGRTGPCADALIAAGIARCVVATVDPNPRVSGGGVARMLDEGIDVTVGTLEREARVLNDGFARFIEGGVPLVTLKAALSVDGRLAPAESGRVRGQPHWLTGWAARDDVQRMRHGADAILTGIGTVLADDPALSDRTGLPRRRRLLRVVLDSMLRVPLESQLVRTANVDVLVFCSEEAPARRAEELERRGVEVRRVVCVDGRLSLAEVLAELCRRRLLSVLVEAGAAVNGAFLTQRLVDKVALFYAETELGIGALPFAEGVASPFVLQESLSRVETAMFGTDVRVTGYLRDAWEATASAS